MKKSNVAAVFMLIFLFLFIFEFYYLGYLNEYNIGMIETIIIISTAILMAISMIIMGKWTEEENLQRYREKILEDKKKENEDKKL